MSKEESFMQRAIQVAILLIVIVLVLIVVVIIWPPKPTRSTGIGVGASLDVERIPRSPVKDPYTYAAKFACGTIPADPARRDFPSVQGRQALPGTYGAYAEVLVPGVYLTAINIRNPTRNRIKIAKQALQTVPERDLPDFVEQTLVPRRVEDNLRMGEGVEVDCVDILFLLTQRQAVGDVIAIPSFTVEDRLQALKRDFVKGFVVIESKVELDVVGVYTFKNVDGDMKVDGKPID